jgi:hypothetical protein
VSRRAKDPSDRELEVRFPELPVTSYLRTMAWGNRTSATLLGDPALEAIARANGVRVLDRAVLRLGALHLASFHEAATRAIRSGTTTMAPVVIAPYRLWSEGLDNAERFAEWLARIGGGAGAPVPAMTRDVESTWRRLFGTARQAYSAPV